MPHAKRDSDSDIPMLYYLNSSPALRTELQKQVAGPGADPRVLEAILRNHVDFYVDLFTGEPKKNGLLTYQVRDTDIGGEMTCPDELIEERMTNTCSSAWDFVDPPTW